VDGVMTDGKIFYFDGKLYRFFNIKDGPAFRMLKLAGVKTAVISGKRSQESRKRFGELGADMYFENVKNKVAVIEKHIINSGIEWKEACYLGDDLPDLPAIKKAGLSMAPSDAAPEVKDAAVRVSKKKGGEGVFREAAEIILKGKGIWEEILEKYLSF
jgi:3-deoxy-D-manno-octulosonate 8-phosphate phosphatase (KDO 8-P phosphatase)